MPAAPSSVGRRSARAPLVLAVDVGSSSTRAIVFDASATIVSRASGSVRYAFETRPAGAATLHADRLVSLVGACIDTAIARCGARAREIAAVGTSVFWHSLIGLDARDRPTTPVLTWADTRARDAARALAGELDQAAVHARTGCYLHASYPPAKVRWLRDAEPGTFSRTVRWCSFAEYLALHLAGERRCAHGMASASGMYDQHRKGWDPSILSALGLPLDALFPISDESLQLSPSRARRWPALRGAAVLPGIGDGALANVGSGCVTEERAALSLGTSGAVRVCSAAARAPAPRGLWEYRLDERHAVLGGAVSNGGNVIDWTRRTLRQTGTPAASRERALELIALPRLSGERSLSWDDRATGVISGLRLSHTAGDISQALILGMCLRLAKVIDALAEAHPVREIVASGGVLRARRDLAQIVADAVGRPLAVAAETEASARGAAIMALVRIGARVSLEAPVRIAHRLRPVPERGERYRELGRRQDRLEEALRVAQLT